MLENFKIDIQSQEMVNFPTIFRKILIEDSKTLQILLKNSDVIRSNMPITAEMALKKYNMFSLENTESFAKILEKTVCLLVLPREIITQTYPHELVCGCFNPNYCKTKKLNHFLIDCRPSREQK